MPDDFQDSTMFLLGNIDANVKTLMTHVQTNTETLEAHDDRIGNLEKTRAKMYGGLGTLAALWTGLAGYMGFDGN